MLRQGDRELNACLETHGTRPSALWKVVLAENVFCPAPLRQKATRKLQESYRQAYIYFAITDGKIARYSEQVV